MKATQVCVLGGTGFVGGHLVNRLATRGREVTVLSRRPERHRAIGVTPGVRLVRADVHDPQALRTHFEGADCVINLVGILNEAPGSGLTFRKVHVELPVLVVDACRTSGVARLLHMSALNADEARGTSEYLRTKGEGENRTHTTGKARVAVTSFRPSVVFGPGDGFFNRFATLLRAAPYFVPLACTESRFAPVYVGDVARAFDRALDDKNTYEQHYDLCGPRMLTLKELVDYTAATLGLRRKVVALNDALSRMQARVLGYVPGKPFTYDNYLSLQTDSVCEENGLERLGITPTDMESVVPWYLGGRAFRNRYNQYRREAHRG